MSAQAARRMAPHPLVDPATVEKTIVDGLLYLEREAAEADLVDLARTIRAAVDVYRNTQPQEYGA